MVPHPASFVASLLILSALHLPTAVESQSQSDGCSMQPVARRIDPPSGTAGRDPRTITKYTIIGESLDQVSSITVLLIDGTGRTVTIVDRMGNSTVVTFHIPDLNLNEMRDALISLRPSDLDCLVTNLTVVLFPELDIRFSSVLIAQPGTTVFFTQSSCIPGQCGDNSTSFSVEVGGIPLQPLNIQNTTLKYAGRFPNFETIGTSQEVVILTQYQAFTLDVFLSFTLIQPPPVDSVTPNVGQRGTVVTITGSGDLHSQNVPISRVRLGGIDAEIVDASRLRSIQVRSRSGPSGNGSVLINTTSMFEGVSYDGPYNYLENGWSQLQDGTITHIVPQAAQEGREIFLCGSSLLGGGAFLSSIQLGSTVFQTLISIPSSPGPSLPGSECIQAEVPPQFQANDVSGIITITSNTGSFVESINNFTIASIDSVTPSRGQPGTIVTIRGLGLLSGYNSTLPCPFIFLSDILATVLSQTNTEIVVRARDPPTPLPRVINITTGATEAPPQYFGVMGGVRIEVQNPFDSSQIFNLSNATGWQLEESGVIDSVRPIFGQHGTLITVTGRNLLAYGNTLTHATIDGINSTILAGADNNIVELIAPNTSSIGSVDIVLFSDTGADVRGPRMFEYREAGVIVDASPRQGQNGTFVVITGTNILGYGQNITSVYFGDILATIDYSTVNDTSVQVRVQANNNSNNQPVVVLIISETSAFVQSEGPIWMFLVQGQIIGNLPQQGQAGTRIEIMGMNLLGGGNTIAKIFLDGVSGTVTSHSISTIIIVMDDFQTQRTGFYPGQIYIESDTGAVVFGGNYMHRASGVIDSFSPTRGRKGTVVTILGRSLLGFGTSLFQVQIAGIVSMIKSFNDTVIVVRAGLSFSTQPGFITLIADTGAVIDSTSNFTYDEPGLVALVSPATGAEGTGVSISGSGLLPSNVQLISITVGGIPVSRVVTESNSEISIIVGPAPPVNADNASIVITASDGSFVDGISFTFISFMISLPNLSRGREGTLIVVSLPNSPQFEPSDNLRTSIDDQSADIVSIDANQRTITVSVPRARRHGMFVADVAIEGMNGLFARLRDGFTYLSEGVICVVEPEEGQTGTRINLEGENFLGGGDSIMSALVVGQQATVRSFTNRTASLQLRQVDIETYPITGDIILTANTGATIRRLFTFTLVSPGNITGVFPPTGQNGTMVNITGKGLLQGNLTIESVTLAGVPAMVVGTPSNTLITVEAGPSSSASSSALPVNITLTSGAIITSFDNQTMFQYLVPGRITSVIPNSGTNGTRTTISGTNLLQGGQRVSQVLLNGVHARFTQPSDTSISVTAQADSQGRGDVVVVSDTGSSVTGTGLWIYDDLGTISRVSPAVSQQGILVTITGVSLLGSATRFNECRLAGILGEVMPPFSDSMVQCRAGASTPSTIDNSGPVQLTTDTGVFLNSLNNNVTFTYYAASINAISQSQGNNGTAVVISGLNLFGTPNISSQVSSITFGSVRATICNASLNEILVRVGLSGNATSNDKVRIESTSGTFLEILNAWNYTRPGQLFSIDPPYGLPGDEIILYGENLFPDITAEYRVIIGQTVAFNVRVINASAVQFQSGIYQNSDLPEQDLPVQVVSSTGETTYDPNVTFRYNATNATALSISPQAGSNGSNVVISGTNLPNIENISRITLAGITANIVSAGMNAITVEAGQPLASGGSGQVIIETTEGSLLGLAGDAWRYFPVLTSMDISPTTGQNGTIVSIDISRISPFPSIVEVYLNNVTAYIVGINNSILSVRAGPSDDTPLGNVALEFVDGIVITIFRAWSYQEPVSIDQLFLPNGYFNTSVNIMGRMFQANSVTILAVYLAGIGTIIESQTNTQLQVRISEDITPATEDGIVGPVVIVANSGATFSSSGGVNFTYLSVRITQVSPTSGTRGTLVTLSGDNLLAGGNNVTSAFLAEIPATVQEANSTAISFVAGSSATDSDLGNITYLMDTGASIRVTNSWTYLKPGNVIFVTPLVGEMGTIVSITGTNLFGGGNRAEAVFLNSHMTTDILRNFDFFIQVRAVAGTGSLQPGNVRIVSDSQAITESPSTIQFSYLSPAIFTTISPRSGQNGTIVTITGDRFHNGEGICRAFLAGVEATITNIQEMNGITSITVEAGRPADLGSFDGPVVVQSNHNTTSISTEIFMYNTEGVILSVTPSLGRNNTICSIEGENLFGGGGTLQNVTLAGVSASIINRTSSRVFVRAGLASSTNNFTGNVVLVSDTNAHVTRIDGWTNVMQGVITSISPLQGQIGTNVTISGQNLLSGGDNLNRLLFDDIELYNISATDTLITARVGQPTISSEYVSDSVTLVSDFGSELYIEYTWNFLNQSNITRLSPPNGFGGTEVTISGINLLGGGTTIMSADVGGIPASVIQSSTNNQVVITTGANGGGMEIMGTLVLESDTGALSKDIWRYDRECPNNTYGNIGSCQLCDSQCQTCIGPSSLNCSLCADFAILLDNSSAMECVSKCPNVSTLDNVCVDTCQINQYAQVNTEQNLTFCYDCHSLCDPNLGCSGPEQSQCQSCRFFMDVVNQTCVERCPREAYYINETKECRPCHQQCSGGCFGPSDAECLGCATLTVDVTSTSMILNTVCRETCPSLYYEDTDRGRRCIPCDSNCMGGCRGRFPSNCTQCNGPFFLYPNTTRTCVANCGSFHYQDTSNECKTCSSLCLPNSGCLGPDPSNCKECSLLQDNRCVSGCPDSTFFIRNSTRMCVKCDESCGSGGCTESGSENCLKRSAFAAGSGTAAIVVIIILILTVVIILLVVFIVWRVRFGSVNRKFNFSSPFKRAEHTGVDENNARYTRKSQVQDIPLTTKDIPLQAIDEDKIMTNPLFVEGIELYSEMGPDDEENQDLTPSGGIEVFYTKTRDEKQSLPEKNQPISGSQDLYTDMDNLPPSLSSPPQLEEAPISQDVYTDMDMRGPPPFQHKEAGSVPILPPKPTEKKPAPPPPAPYTSEMQPASEPLLPAKLEKPIPPGPPSEPTDTGSPELCYTDMHGGIKEVFINTGAQDDVYDDVCTSPPTSSSPPPSSVPIIDDGTYEDTDTALAIMEKYRKSFGAGGKKGMQLPPQPVMRSNRGQITQRQSAPNLPSGPIPKKKSSTPLPQTPLQKSLSSSSNPTSPISPTSPYGRPQSVVSVPEEESLYDDISGYGVKPLVEKSSSTLPAMGKTSKKQPKGKLWKK